MDEYENTGKDMQAELMKREAGEKEGRQDSGKGGSRMKYGYEVKKYRRGGGNVFWGIVLVVGALAMLMNRLGYFQQDGLSFWSVFFSVCLAAMILDGLKKRSFGEIVFGLAFLIIVNDKLLGLEAITPWPVLLAACAVTGGLNMLFPGFRRHRHVFFRGGKNPAEGKTTESREGDAVSYENTFGGTVKYITGEISTVNMSNSFGAMEVYFSDAVLKNSSAEVHISSSFGGVVLYIPSDWRVILNVESVFAGVEEEGHCNQAGEKVLYIDGQISFCGLEIKYL